MLSSSGAADGRAPGGTGGPAARFSCDVARRPNAGTFVPTRPPRIPDPNARASIRKQLHSGYGARPPREYRGVTPLSWGRRFEDTRFVSAPALALIEARGGTE